MRRSAAAAGLLGMALLTACSGGKGEADPFPSISAGPTCPVDGTSDVPAECVPGDNGFDVTPAPVSTDGAPAASADIPALVLPRRARDLVLGGNDLDPRLVTRTFSVTVPTGSRLSITSACRGFSTLYVTTRPVTKAEHDLPCGQTQANELTVLDPVLLSAPVTYEVTVRAAAPSRWFVALGAVTRPAPGA